MIEANSEAKKRRARVSLNDSLNEPRIEAFFRRKNIGRRGVRSAVVRAIGNVRLHRLHAIPIYSFRDKRNVMKVRAEQQQFDFDGNARERLIVWIKRRMDEYGITLETLAESIEADANAVRAVMYRDAYGNTWDGYGDKPDWLARAIYAGQNIEHFRCR